MASDATTVEIASVTYAEGDPYPSFVVAGFVTQGVRAGENVSGSLSLGPKAGVRLKRFLTLFGLGDLDDLEVDEDSRALVAPNLVGATIASDGDALPWPFEDAPR